MDTVNLNSMLECPICLKQYEQPKVLQCQHSFCLDCLFRIYEDQVDPKNKKIPQILCPVCKQITIFPSILPKQKKPLPKELLNRLIPNNLTLIGLIEIRKTSKALKDRQNSSTSGESGANKSNDINGCKTCESAPTWICLFCDRKLCDSCLGSHLDEPGEHETFNLSEETEKLRSLSLQCKPASPSEEPLTEKSFHDLPSVDRQNFKLELSEQIGLKTSRSESALPTKVTATSEIGSSPSCVQLETSQEMVESPPQNETMTPVEEDRPIVPRRAFPPSLTKLISADSYEPNRPKKICIGMDGSIYVCFHEENSGIRKFDREGKFLMKMANVQKIEDMVLDHIHHRIILLALYRTDDENETVMLQSHNSGTGQMINFVDLKSPHRFLCLGQPRLDTLFLIEDTPADRLKIYHRGKELTLKSSPALKGIKSNEIRAVCSSPQGNLYILARPGGQSNLIMSFNPIGETFAAIPIRSSAFADPVSLFVDKKLIYVADKAKQKLVILSHSGMPVDIKNDNGLSSDHFNWRPCILNISLANQIFVSDEGSRNIWKVPAPMLKK